METTQESFWYKHRLAIAITLILMISGTIGLTFAVRSMKAGSLVSVAQKNEQTLCAEPYSLEYMQTQVSWGDYEARQELAETRLPELDLQEIQTFIDTQCKQASLIAEAARFAQTESEKVLLYNQTTDLLHETNTVSRKMAEAIYADATACVDALGKAINADTESDNALVMKAKTYASNGIWRFCSHFADEAVRELNAQQECNEAYLHASDVVVTQSSFILSARDYREQSDWESCIYFSKRAVQEANAITSCKETYAQAMEMAQQLQLSLPTIDDAEASISASDWASCSFYSEQALATLAGYMPTETPPP